jgi:hypothetical protein
VKLLKAIMIWPVSNGLSMGLLYFQVIAKGTTWSGDKRLFPAPAREKFDTAIFVIIDKSR